MVKRGVEVEGVAAQWKDIECALTDYQLGKQEKEKEEKTA